MTIRIQLFAAARDAAACDFLELDLEFPFQVHQLRKELLEQHSCLATLLENARFAIDRRYVVDSTTVETAEEIALILPVSGG